jgi:hypothetical protein
VGYCAEPLNTHRRHAASVTHTLNVDKHITEIVACHAFAGATFELNSETRRAQGLYLQEVRKQLDAKPDKKPRSPIGAKGHRAQPKKCHRNSR